MAAPTNLQIVKPKKVFRSYIGVKSYPERLDKFPADIIKVDDFHFILGFATENNIKPGQFTINWNTKYFGPENVVSLKIKKPSAKVIISIGGRGKEREFNPQGQNLWIDEAFDTIKGILEYYKVEDPSHCESPYKIDGIDINYQFINPQVDVKVFSNCIGTLIKELKEAKINVNIVSIAPSASSNDHYKQLYSDYPEHIDYVCYQFYNQDMSRYPTQMFENLYDALIADYSADIVLAGGTTDPDNKNNLKPENFIEGCRALINHGKLPGIFIWNANDSDTLKSNERFIVEGMAQDLLISSSCNSFSLSNKMPDIHKPTNLLTVQTMVFRSYIGVKSYPKRLDEFPADIIRVDDFHFIVGFAIENTIGTGYFTTNWNTNYFGPEKVVSLKKKKPSAKVIISIGGRGKEREFNPQEQNLWIHKAFRTIKGILEDYKVEDPCHCEPHYTIDGIDINYEFINPQVDVEVFSNCIGTLIKKLKDAEINVNIVSIAPSDSTNKYYKQLYSDYSEHIKYVCYQFYNQDMSLSPPPNKPTKKFEDLYDHLIADYSAGIVLAGGTTDPDNENNLKPENFIEGCKALINHGKLPGIFIWNANDSDTLQSNERFILEGMAQDLMISSSSN